MDTVLIYEGEDGQWYWRRVAANGEVISHGEGHPRIHDAIRAATRANADTANYKVVEEDEEADT